MHVFELDRLLSQMAQDCLDSLSSSSSTSSSIYSTLSSNSSLITPQRRTMVYDSSSVSTTLTKSKTTDNNFTPIRKSTECLHTTPVMQKQAAPLAPHCHTTLDSDRRPKSASTILLASQNSTTPTVLSPRTHKFQRPTNRHFKMKMYRSEDDIMSAVQRNDDRQDQKSDLNGGVGNGGEDDDATITLCENETDDKQLPQTNVRALAKQFEQKTNSLPDHARLKLKSPDSYQTIHYATARTIINEQQEENEDEDELTWPQQPQPQQQQQQQQQTSSHGGIKKFVRHSLKIFTTQSQQQQQQNKKTGK